MRSVTRAIGNCMKTIVQTHHLRTFRNIRALENGICTLETCVTVVCDAPSELHCSRGGKPLGGSGVNTGFNLVFGEQNSVLLENKTPALSENNTPAL